MVTFTTDGFQVLQAIHHVVHGERGPMFFFFFTYRTSCITNRALSRAAHFEIFRRPVVGCISTDLCKSTLIFSAFSQIYKIVSRLSQDHSRLYDFQNFCKFFCATTLRKNFKIQLGFVTFQGEKADLQQFVNI